MFFAGFALLALLLAGVEVRRSLREGSSPTRASLLLGGASWSIAWLFQLAVLFFAVSPAAHLISERSLLAAQAVVLLSASVPLWISLVRLTVYRVRPRELLKVLPFLLLAMVVRAAAPRLPVGVAEILALPALVRARWRRETAPAVRGLVSLFGLLFVLLNLIPLRTSGPEANGMSYVAGCEQFYNWVRILATVYMLIALPGLLWGIELPIRSVKRRLLVSHLMTGLVPLVLLALFWGLSTYLSVSGERARIAARYLNESSADLALTLKNAVCSGASETRRPEEVRHSLIEWGRLQSAVYPGLRLWVCPGGAGTSENSRASLTPAGASSALVRLFGDPIPGEHLLASWTPDKRRAGILLLEGGSFLGSACFGVNDEGASPQAIALVPISDLLGEGFQRKFDATSHLETGFVVRTEGGLGIGSSGAADLGLTSETEFARSGQTSPGAALLPAVEWSNGEWHNRQVLLWVSVGLLQALRGLAQNLRENPFNLFPLIILVVVAGLFVLVEVLTVGMVVSMGRSVLRALSALRQGTARLRSGNFRYRIPIESADELWDVAGSFNEMAADLDKARDLEIEKERMEGELDLARQIQTRLLPVELPVLPRLDLAGTSVPARQVGGDYYNVLRLGEDRVGLVAADVSGKGVPAALLMSSFRASLLSIDLDAEGPARTMARLNQFLHHSVEPGRFVTAFLAVLSASTGRIVYSNAGHNPPFVLRSAGSGSRQGLARTRGGDGDGDGDETALLREGGLVLGLFQDTQYEQGETVLERGDLLALYTDGVTEAADEEDRFYGEERLLSCLRRHRDEPCLDILRELLDEIRTFSGVSGQSDDVTVLLARMR